MHNSTSRAAGAALALLVGSAAGLSAQTSATTPATPDSSRVGATSPSTSTATGTATSSASGSMTAMQDSTPRVRSTTTRRRRVSGEPVRKDLSGMAVQKDIAPAPAPEPAPAPAPAPEPVPAPEPAPPPPPPVTDSVVTTTTTTTTTIPATPERKLGNGLYFGVQGGANFPQNNIRDAYRTGFNGGIQLGYDPKTSPIGLRVNALYNRFRGDNTNALAVQPNRASDSETYSAFADAVLRLPFGKFLGSTSGFYLVGGPGVTLFRNYRDFQQQTGTTVGGSETGALTSNNATRFSLNGGVGLEYGIGNVSLFTEGRYVRVFTQGRDTDYLPLTVGLRFHGR